MLAGSLTRWYVDSLSPLSRHAQVYTVAVQPHLKLVSSGDSRLLLCVQGWRSARIYTVNGVCLFASWLFARIVLFLWFFKHMWEHRSDIAELRTHVMVLILTVPPLLFVLNVFWFGKIVRGLIKLLTGQLAKVMTLPNMPSHDAMPISPKS